MVKFDKHIFINSISNFEMPAEFSHEDLSNLLKQYPAFNSIQLINAVLTNKESPELFDKNLSKIATKVIDRSILHDYIFKNKFTFNAPKSKEEIISFKEVKIATEEPVLEIKPKKEITEKAIELVPKVNKVAAVIKEEKKAETTQKVIPVQKIEQPIIEKEKSTKKEVVQQKETYLQKIEKLKAKISANKLKEAESQKRAEENKPKAVKPVITPIEKEKIEAIQLKHAVTPIAKKKEIAEKKVIVKTAPSAEVISKKPLTIHEFLKNTKLVKVESVTKKKPKTTPVAHAKDSNFLHWLKHTDKPIISEEPKNITPDKQEEKIAIVETPTKNITREQVEETIEKKVEQAIEEKEDLIPFDKPSGIEHEMHQEIKKSTDPLDDFISTQIARKRVVRTKNTEKTLTNVGLISETLAEILVIQQKYTEAIEVYNTLSLKYPEKSIYFANQIEKIKNY
jgi:hypothetical protein